MNLRISNCLIYRIASLACIAGVLGSCQVKPEEVSFEKNHLWREFYTEGVTVADVNRDGQKDIIAGARWFEAPQWNVHDIWIHAKFDYTKGYSDSFLNFAMDVNEDGWQDLISFNFPGEEVWWFENPKGDTSSWVRHLIDSAAANESPTLVDVNGDGKKDLIFSHEKAGQMVWATPVVEGNLVTWKQYPISTEGVEYPGMFDHGLGWGDVNRDGFNDILIKSGWWEAPPEIDDEPWTFHPADLGENCSQMLVYDYDNDGDNDVVSSSAHEYGLWWHEQSQDALGKSKFTTHNIDTTFSELHSIALVDINADSKPDLVTGKRYFSHQGRGPGGRETPFLYWFELKSSAESAPTWQRHLIDEDSGVGIQFVVEDMNLDNKPDIIIANKKGVFYFKQK